MNNQAFDTYRSELQVTIFTLGFCLCLAVNGQQIEKADSITELNEVIIKAFYYNRPLNQVPATIAVLQTEDLQRFNESTLVPSVNTMPGVRMEERSPGSYRVSIRGSTLRSPFGVRNVKVYWNHIPFTDPGGNTYINLLDPAMIGTSEIIKGPGSSLYGAGTGGVLLLNSPVISNGKFLKSTFQAGSFGGELFQLGYENGNDDSGQRIQYLHQQSDGYRSQTRMSRDVVNSTFHFDVNERQRIETYIFYSDLFYETPGGLTLAEFKANPKQARPATGPTPGAVEQRASVHNQSFYMGLTHEYHFNPRTHNRTSVYGNLVKFENPSIRNFEHRNEQNLGARSVIATNYKTGESVITVLGGGEFQWGFSPIKTYQNLKGREGALQIDDEAKLVQYSLFGQVELNWKKVNATAGLSYNAQQLNFHRLSNTSSKPELVNYDPVVMPRVAVLVHATDHISFSASISKGFSPPTLAEVNASNGVFNKDLKPETGTSFETGMRVNLLNQKLTVLVTAYNFGLDETIVIRRETDGSEFFINAGKTNQKGLESALRYTLPLSQEKLNVILWTSYAYNDYQFKQYVKGNDDFSGKQLTGTPKHVLSSGADVSFPSGLYLRATVLFSGKLPLNDANSVYATSYTLPGFRLGFQRKRYEVYFGGDNLLDETYSLGNDLNAFGGRYYNAAPGRGFYGGVKINLAF